MAYQGVLHKYGFLLDLPSHTQTVSLLEGNTPLIKANRLCRQLGGGFELFIKYEGLNPTGSFKDRGMTAAVSEALGRGDTTIICASTGNTAASAAAYAARAGMKSIVLIQQGRGRETGRRDRLRRAGHPDRRLVRRRVDDGRRDHEQASYLPREFNQSLSH